MVFSVTKDLASTVIHRLVDPRLLAYDAPVAEYWPAFGANGKSAITIRDMMRHRVGLSLGCFRRNARPGHESICAR